MAQAWASHLTAHPDPTFAQYLLRGLQAGFRIGPQGRGAPRQAKRNLRSAYEHPEVIDGYLTREVQLGRVVRLPRASALSLPNLRISPFGVIPKRNRPNKWRLIVDLSSPEGSSVNDELDRGLCSIKYASIDDAVAIIRRLGTGALLAKVDLREAYRVVPVHPEDRPRLGMQWKGDVYLDAALPFGLRSAPKIFSALADGLLWILQSQGMEESLHYLDDFLLLGPPASPKCAEALRTLLAICGQLGVPVAEEKTEGPLTTLTFLGIEIDTASLQLRLPQEKLQRLAALLNEWMRGGPTPTPRRSGTKRDLLSLIGLLNHAASVVKPGRTFLRSLIDASTSVRALDHHVHLPARARADIAWWYTFLQSWNGVSLLPAADPSQLTLSDASGSWGGGASWNGRWFQIQWPSSWAQASIAPKELIPIVIAVAVWGHHWAGQRICCLCDNMAVVFAINKGSARDPQLMRLLRILFFFCAHYRTTITARHIAGVLNSSADALSRNNLSLFLSLNPQASPQPTAIPADLQLLLFNQSLRWTSPSWTRLFSSTLESVLHPQPGPAIPPPSAASGPSAKPVELGSHSQ